MKTSPPTSRHFRNRFQSFRSLSRVACRHGKFLAVLAGSSLLAVGAIHAQNAEFDVASESMTQQTTATTVNLNTASTYSGGVVPGTTGDLTFNAANYYSQASPTGYTPAAGFFSVSPALSIGSLNDLSTSQAITLTNGNGNTQAPLTLNGGDLVSGNAADLLYVASGANLTVSNLKPATNAPTSTVNLVLGASGNFDVVGTATISAPISSGTVNAPAANPNGFTKTGAGLLTLSSATNNYTGGTIVSTGTLATAGTGTLGSGNVTIAGGATLTLVSTTSIGASAILNFAAASKINLNNATADTLSTIIDTDTKAGIAPGTYTANQLDTAFGVNSFTGTGSLTLTAAAAVPEPSTWVGIVLAAGAFGFLRRRQAAARLS